MELYMTLDLNCLGSNLQEIYSGSHKKDGKIPALVANMAGTRIYDSSRGWGRLWRYFYGILNYFGGGNIKLAKLRKALEKTTQIFQAQLKIITAHAEKYLKYLGERCEGGNPPESDFRISRRAISDWNNATLPFLRLVHSKKNKELTLFLNHFSQGRSPIEEAFSSSLFPQFKSYQQIISLEGLFGEALPLSHLKKMTMGIDLGTTENEQMNHWIIALNKHAEVAENISLIQEALRGIVSHIKTNHTSRFLAEPNFSTLALALIARNCRIFEKRDIKHILWRESLKKGSEISCNGKPIVLGEPIGKKKEGEEDNILIFEMERDPESVVIIGINRATLGLRQKKALAPNYWGIESMTVKELDSHGRCAVVERLRDPTGGKSWLSSNSILSPEDVRRCQPLLLFITNCLKTNITPVHFFPRYVMVDKEGKMKYAKVLAEPSTRRLFSFNKLEKFVYQAASGNSIVFQHLMKASQLSRHRFSSFYRTVIENTLKESSTHGNEIAIKEMKELYALREIQDVTIEKRAEILITQILKMKKKCCKKVRALHPHQTKEEIDKKVIAELIKKYQASDAAGILLPTLISEVVSVLS